MPVLLHKLIPGFFTLKWIATISSQAFSFMGRKVIAMATFNLQPQLACHMGEVEKSDLTSSIEMKNCPSSDHRTTT